MNPQEALEEAKKIAPIDEYGDLLADNPKAHHAIEELMKVILRQHGYNELCDYINEISFWYE